MKILKKITYYSWILAIIILFVLFLVDPDSFSPESIKAAFLRYQFQLLGVYILISLMRGFFLFPSTPFVFAGVLLFPTQLWLVFVISLIGVIVGASAIYYFSDYLGFSKKLSNKYPKQIEKWRKRLDSPKASLIIVGWSFFPFVPTDLICYVAGIVKMPYRYLILGVLIGEAALIYLYVFYGTGLVECFFR
jgi:uncharacterized membrane protein YdjX (TVP38/TMEM64 family)